MTDWEKVRDWEVNEAIFDLQHDSYDFIGRDIPLNNDTDVDILRYRTQTYSAEAGFFYSGKVERAKAMESLDSARRVLEGHSPRLYLVDVDSVRRGYDIELEGHFVFDNDIELGQVKPHLEDFMRVPFDSPELKSMRCKR